MYDVDKQAITPPIKKVTTVTKPIKGQNHICLITLARHLLHPKIIEIRHIDWLF